MNLILMEGEVRETEAVWVEYDCGDKLVFNIWFPVEAILVRNFFELDFEWRWIGQSIDLLISKCGPNERRNSESSLEKVEHCLRMSSQEHWDRSEKIWTFRGR